MGSLFAPVVMALLASMTGSVDPEILNVVKHFQDPAIVYTLRCESLFQQYQPDGSLLLGKQGEIGIAQFKQETWDWMNQVRGTDLDITNALAQLNMIEWAFQHNYQSLWAGYTNWYQYHHC
jgi:hypothetical protein